jgi:glycosyltransferase involved in cell wall biosynthesis
VSQPGILLLIGHLEGGGAERQCLLLARGLRRVGFPVTVVAGHAAESILAEYEAMGATVRLLAGGDRPRFDRPGRFGPKLRAVSSLVSVLRAARPAVVQSFLPVGNCAATLVRRAAGVPVVVASHRYAGRATWNYDLWQAAEAVVCRAADINLANSAGVARHLTRHLFLPGRTIRIVYNGAEPLKADCLYRREEVRRKLGLTGRDLALVKVANLWPYKGHQDLVRAVAQVRQLQPRLRVFFIGGDRGYRHALEKMIAALGVSDRITLLGERSEVCDLLPAFDLCVSASRGEGMSNAIMEAMQHGLPVIGSRVAGTPELLEEGEAGRLFESGDVAALSADILELAGNPELRRDLGRRAQRRMAERFSDREMVRATLAVYAEAARRKGLAAESWAFDRGAELVTAEEGTGRTRNESGS